MSVLRKRFIPLIAFLAFILAAQLAMAASSDKPGSLDPAFGHNGITPVALPAADYPIGMTAARDGSILVLGNPRYGATWRVEDDCGEAGHYRGMTWQVTRYQRDGKLMSSFGRNGEVVQHFKGDSSNLHYSRPTSVFAQPDGKFVVAGLVDIAKDNIPPSSQKSGARTSDQDCEPGYAFPNTPVAGAVRFLPDGRHDRSYGTNGTGLLKDHELGDARAALDNKLRLVLAGNVIGRNTGVMARLTADGKPDRSFGERGRVILKVAPRSLVVDSVDRILVATEGRVWRFDEHGDPDKTFGVNGVLSLGDIWIDDVVPTTRGLTLLVSRDPAATKRSTVGVVKINDSGGAMPAFGLGGSTDLGEGSAKSLFIDASGRAVVAWTEQTGKAVHRWRVTRVSTTGAIDPTFDSSGNRLVFGGNASPDLIARPSRYGTVVAGRSGTKPGKGGRTPVLARLRD